MVQSLSTHGEKWMIRWAYSKGVVERWCLVWTNFDSGIGGSPRRTQVRVAFGCSCSGLCRVECLCENGPGNPIERLLYADD